ncbi:MAG TPA: hypothetical protein VH115_01800, partial [Solirubrobacteraceae bacterium]|nr:hypothetical protein [Solirubrobacteraceae bacterium]
MRRGVISALGRALPGLAQGFRPWRRLPIPSAATAADPNRRPRDRGPDAIAGTQSQMTDLQSMTSSRGARLALALAAALCGL